MIEMNESQAAFMKELAGDNPFQVVVKPLATDPPAKITLFDELNKNTDELIAAGFVQDVTSGVPKPENYNREFRVIGITALGLSFFGVDLKGAGQA